MRERAELAAPLSLIDCQAKGPGGAIYAQGKLVSQQISCTHCHAPTSACLHLESGEANIESLMLHSGSLLVPESPIIVAAGDDANVTLGTVDWPRIARLHSACRADAAGTAPVPARREPPIPGRRHCVPRMFNGTDPPRCGRQGSFVFGEASRGYRQLITEYCRERRCACARFVPANTAKQHDLEL